VITVELAPGDRVRLSYPMMLGLSRATLGMHVKAVSRDATIKALQRRGLITVDRRGYMDVTKRGLLVFETFYKERS
jgi:Mn-dependent DtxR family transcriptional regulator